MVRKLRTDNSGGTAGCCATASLTLEPLPSGMRPPHRIHRINWHGDELCSSEPATDRWLTYDDTEVTCLRCLRRIDGMGVERVQEMDDYSTKHHPVVVDDYSDLRPSGREP